MLNNVQNTEKNNHFLPCLLCRQKSAIYNDTEQYIKLNKITISIQANPRSLILANVYYIFVDDLYFILFKNLTSFQMPAFAKLRTN